MAVVPLRGGGALLGARAHPLAGILCPGGRLLLELRPHRGVLRTGRGRAADGPAAPPSPRRPGPGCRGPARDRAGPLPPAGTRGRRRVRLAGGRLRRRALRCGGRGRRASPLAGRGPAGRLRRHVRRVPDLRPVDRAAVRGPPTRPRVLGGDPRERGGHHRLRDRLPPRLVAALVVRARVPRPPAPVRTRPRPAGDGRDGRRRARGRPPPTRKGSSGRLTTRSGSSRSRRSSTATPGGRSPFRSRSATP